MLHKGLAEAYRRIHAAENGYRGGRFDMPEALDDTIEAGRLLSSLNLKGYVPSPDGDVLADGVAQVDSHMIGRRYTPDHARIAASRAAHLAALIRSDGLPDDLRSLSYSESSTAAFKGKLLDGRLAILNRLKGFNPEAFYHWLKVQETLTAGRQSQTTG